MLMNTVLLLVVMVSVLLLRRLSFITEESKLSIGFFDAFDLRGGLLWLVI